MKLYYDNECNLFSLTNSETYECVFESYDRNDRIGWEAGRNPVIRKGPLEIIIGTNFYPKAPHREYLGIIVSINGIRLIPLSMAVRKAKSYYHFGKDELTIQQFGIKNHIGRNPATIVQIQDQIDWRTALSELCYICNHYEGWIIRQTEILLSKLKETKLTSFYNISTLLEFVRVYDEIVPSIIPVYRKFIDSYCIEAMKGVLDYIGRARNNNNIGLNKINKIAKAKNGDVIWQYIKDYLLTEV